MPLSKLDYLVYNQILFVVNLISLSYLLMIGLFTYPCNLINNFFEKTSIHTFITQCDSREPDFFYKPSPKSSLPQAITDSKKNTSTCCLPIIPSNAAIFLKRQVFSSSITFSTTIVS